MKTKHDINKWIEPNMVITKLKISFNFFENNFKVELFFNKFVF